MNTSPEMSHITQALLVGTKYTGSKQPMEKKISASNYDLELRQLYLNYVYGTQDNQTDFGANTAGSLLQLGVDIIFADNPNYKIAIRKQKLLPNGWAVSGEVDLIDLTTNSIIDFKLLAGGGYNKAIKHESYIANMSIYRWLFDNQFPNSYLYAINKAGSKVKDNIYDIVNITDNLWNVDQVEQILTDKTEELNYLVDNPDEIPICDKFKYGRSSETKQPNLCAHYCDVNHLCDDYNNTKSLSNHLATKQLLL